MRFLFCIIIFIFLFSCKSTNHGFKTAVTTFETEKKYTFENRHYKLDSNAKKTDNFVLDRKDITLLGLFRIQNTFSQHVSMEIGKDDSLRLSSLSDSARIFSFKLRRRKHYYQYFSERDILEIPPIVSFFYGRRKVDRLRIALTSSGELIVNNKYVDHNNILFLGAGGEYNQIFTYKLY